MIVGRAASKRTHQNSPVSLALLLPDLWESVQALDLNCRRETWLQEQLLRYGTGLSSLPVSPPANIAAGLPGLSISHPGPFPLAQAPTPQIYRLNRCIPPVRLEGEREQKGHFTVKHHFYKMATAWEMLAPGSEL